MLNTMWSWVCVPPTRKGDAVVRGAVLPTYDYGHGLSIPSVRLCVVRVGWVGGCGVGRTATHHGCPCGWVSWVWPRVGSRPYLRRAPICVRRTGLPRRRCCGRPRNGPAMGSPSHRYRCRPSRPPLGLSVVEAGRRARPGSVVRAQSTSSAVPGGGIATEVFDLQIRKLVGSTVRPGDDVTG